MQLLSSSTAGWRSVWQVHSAVDLFPALAPDQLTDLAEDIRKNGLLHPVIYCKKPDGTHILIDGRSRLDALELLGLLKITNGQMTIDGMADGTWKREDPDAAADPIAYVISANIRRRHLDRDQRRSVLEQLIETDPTKSARQVARLAGVSPTTAVAVRDALVLRGDVSKLDTSTDSLRPPTAHTQGESEDGAGISTISFLNPELFSTQSRKLRARSDCECSPRVRSKMPRCGTPELPEFIQRDQTHRHSRLGTHCPELARYSAQSQGRGSNRWISEASHR